MQINQTTIATLFPVDINGQPAPTNGANAVFTTDHPELVVVTQIDALNASLTGVAGAVVPAGGLSVNVACAFDSADGTALNATPVVLQLDAAITPPVLQAVGGTIHLSAPTP